MKNLTYILIILSVACSKDDMFEDTYQIPAPSVEVPVKEAAQTPVAEATQTQTDVATTTIEVAAPVNPLFVEGETYTNVIYDIWVNENIEGLEIQAILDGVEYVENSEFWGAELKEALRTHPQVFEKGQVISDELGFDYIIGGYASPNGFVKYNAEVNISNVNAIEGGYLDWWLADSGKRVAVILSHELMHVVNFDFSHDHSQTQDDLFAHAVETNNTTQDVPTDFNVVVSDFEWLVHSAQALEAQFLNEVDDYYQSILNINDNENVMALLIDTEIAQ